MAKVPERKKQLPPLRNADMRRYKVSLKGKHFGINSENHEIVLPATACRGKAIKYDFTDFFFKYLLTFNCHINGVCVDTLTLIEEI